LGFAVSTHFGNAWQPTVSKIKVKFKQQNTNINKNSPGAAALGLKVLVFSVKAQHF